jgi:ferritin-like protein
MAPSVVKEEIPMETIIAAAISAAAAILVCLLNSRRTTNEVTHKLELHQAVTDAKLDALREEVKKHNNVIERTFKLEGQMQECIHDIRDLKAYHKPKPET